MSHWSKHLPSELLDRIVSLIDTDTDLIRFGSVCSSWHTSAATRRLTAAFQVLPGYDYSLTEFHLIKHTISLVGDRAKFESVTRKWTSIPDRGIFMDVISHKGELLGVDSTGRLVIVGKQEEDESDELIVAATGSSHGFRGEKFLVHSINGELLLVDKCTQNDWGVVNFNFNFGPPRLNAYKLNEEEKTWVEIQSLGDTVLFLGDESAFSVSSSDLHGCTTRNCIFFTDTPSRICPSEEMDALYGMNVFDLQSGEVTPLKNCDNYSKLLWPPPAWLSPSSSSFDDVSPPKLSSIRTLLLFFNVISMFETDRLKMKAFGGWVVPEESESIPGGTLVTFRLVEFARLALVLLT
ncbi:F-box protein SKIP23 [Linum perenne]